MAMHLIFSHFYMHMEEKDYHETIKRVMSCISRQGSLDVSEGYHNLGNSYYNGRGVVMDEKKAKHYYELAAMMGSVNARHNIGALEFEADDHRRAMKHFMIAARAGYELSLKNVNRGFMKGMVTKDECANTLRAYQKSQDEMKSDERDKAASEMQIARLY